ncbi:MAG: Smr/MutS family protein [Rhizobacter sp.]|nr:Smr/MutS family protein [Rhizobacter sp.]
MNASGLHELGPVKAALQRARREAAEAAALAAAKAALEQRERDIFSLTVGLVLPLRKAPGALVAKARPSAIPRQRLADEAAVMVEALSDDFDVESLLETDDALSFRRRGIGPEVVRKLRRGVWAIQAQLDLHGLRRDGAREALGAFLREAGRNGWRCVRVVHGKGHGSPGREPVLKGKVKSWLVQRNEVIAFTQARAAQGGAGALVVLLASTRRAVPA